MAEMLSTRIPAISWPLKSSPKSTIMGATSIAFSPSGAAATAATAASATPAMTAAQSSRKLPVLLFDIMDTVVRDPFYQDIPAFFGMSLKELIECKHPTAWTEFETGVINEAELERKFFKDGRSFDLEGLKKCISRGYSYVDGFESLLRTLKQNNYEMHAFTNYPIWYNMIEEKLKISTYLSWTFCSCIYGKRKPDPDFYLEVLNHLKVDPGNCIFIDDRMKNIEAAVQVGIVGMHFKNVDMLIQDLSRLGIDFSTDQNQRSQYQPCPSEDQTS